MNLQKKQRKKNHDAYKISYVMLKEECRKYVDIHYNTAYRHTLVHGHYTSYKSKEMEQLKTNLHKVQNVKK